MEELVDICDKNTGLLTGKIISKEEAHSKGIWHTTVHLLVVNNDKTKTLIQKRNSDKKLFPNLWDVAVGGHISSNETADNAIKREMNEELGLNPSSYEITYLERTKEKLICKKTLCYNYVSIYIIYTDININDLKIQKEELSDIKWVTKNELNALIHNNEVVPHNIDYKLLNEILIY